MRNISFHFGQNWGQIIGSFGVFTTNNLLPDPIKDWDSGIQHWPPPSSWLLGTSAEGEAEAEKQDLDTCLPDGHQNHFCQRS